jgi:hypothetical protein
MFAHIDYRALFLLLYSLFIIGFGFSITAPISSSITARPRELKREENPKSQILNPKQIQNSNVQNSKHMPVAKRKEPFFLFLLLYSLFRNGADFFITEPQVPSSPNSRFPHHRAFFYFLDLQGVSRTGPNVCPY